MQADHIIWDPKYSVHVDEIDAQHQELFSTVNHLIDLHADNSGELYPVLKRLVDYLSRHFRTEQKHMMEMGFPDLARHIREHQLFTDKVQEFLGQYRDQDENLIHSMLLFLRHWIHSHTTTIDMKYADYFKNRGE